MSISAALNSQIFLTYLAVVGGILLLTGLLLAILSGLGRDVSSVRRTYYGWLVMVPLVMGTILLGRIPIIIGVTALAIFGFKEFARATGLYDDWWMTGTVYMGILALGLVTMVSDPRTGDPGWYGMFMTLPVYVVTIILVIPIIRNRARGQLRSIALASLGFVYFGWMFSHLGFLANTPRAYGYLLFVLFAVEINDVSAFIFGKLFGGRKLRDEISPNKTVAGSLGAIGVSLMVPWILLFSFDHFGPLHLILTGLIVGIGGQLGDLVISLIKRDIGIKDMGTVISGHGGILDRVDSMIFVAPLFFHMIRWFHGLS